MFFRELDIKRALHGNGLQQPGSICEEDFLTRMYVGDTVIALHMGVDQVEYLLTTSKVEISAPHPVIYVTAFNETCVNAVYDTLLAYTIYSEEKDDGASLEEYIRGVMGALLKAPTGEAECARASTLRVARIR